MIKLVPAVTLEPAAITPSMSRLANEPTPEPETRPATIPPEALRFLRPETMSAPASSTRALLAAPAPLVIPSSFSRSVSLRSADPMMKLVPAVTLVPATMPLSMSKLANEPTPEPETKPATMPPEALRFLRPETMSAPASSTRALLAAPAPLVIPSSFSRSVSLRSADPMTKLVPAVTLVPAAIPLSMSKLANEPTPEPETRPATMPPDALRFLRPETMSAPASRTNALLAAPAPLVIPSSFSRSVSLRSAEPITKLVPAVTEPAATSSEPETVLAAVIESPAVILPPAETSPAAATIEPEMVFATVRAPALSKLVLALKVKPVPSSTATLTPLPEPEAKSIF